jgi:predicted TIM-barrel fold metal-dependent hydrolase
MKELVNFLEEQPAPDFLKMIGFPDMNEEDRENILGENAARLLKPKGE